MAFGADCFLDCDRQGFKGQIKQTYPETLTLRSVKDDNYVCGKQVYFTQAPSVEGSHVRFQKDQIYVAYGPAYHMYSTFPSLSLLEADVLCILKTRTIKNTNLEVFLGR